MSVQYYIGTSGWHYDHWRSLFYPPELSKDKWLEFYARHFATVEINNSFYRLPSEAAFANWYRSAPAGFVFAVKVSRYITHIKRLKESAEPLKKFIDRARGLGEKLGPLLYQLPPNMRRNDERLESFLSILSRDQKHVFEFRHRSWFDGEVLQTLHNYSAGLCLYNMPNFTTPVVATADFGYIRFHGKEGLYSSSYSDAELAEWARKLADLARDLKAMYIYFNNDVEAYAVKNAMTIAGYLSHSSLRGPPGPRQSGVGS